MLHSGESQLTCLEQVQVTFQGKTFTCNTLEHIGLGSREKSRNIILGGKSLNNTGLANSK